MPWLLTLLLAFVPDSSVPPGPPAPHHAFTPHLQARWSGDASWFGETHGRWSIRWDERNRTPRALLGPGTPVHEASALVADVARLGGVDPASLQPVGREGRGARSAVRFEQRWEGAPIVGAGVDVIAQHGRVHLIWARLHRPALSARPLPGEVVLPTDDDGRLTYHLVTRHVEGDDTVFRDRRGDEVARWSDRHPLELELPERTVGDPEMVVPAREVTVRAGEEEALTDDLGDHPLVGPVDVSLSGPHLEVLRG